MLTVRQKLDFVINWVQRRLDKSVAPVTPRFNESVEHFLIHAGA